MKFATEPIRQPNKVTGDFQDPFTLTEPPKYYNYTYNKMASRTISMHIQV